MMNASPRILRRLAMTGALAATTWVGTALAQTTPLPSPGPTTGETDTMEQYLTNHPRVAEELHNNPNLINDPNWLAKHPNVQNWMNTHQNVKTDAASNPKYMVNQTERETANRDRRAMNHTDEFLAKHPETAKELSANPSLINDPKYLADHPGLNNYLNEHPGVKNEWQEHPKAFADAARADARANREAREERQEKAHPVARPAKVAKK